MPKVNQLRAGVLLSYINLLIGNIIPFIYTPYMLSVLGQNEYGLYNIAVSITGYLTLLNFGIGSTVIRYLAKYRANDDKEGEERVIGLFTCVFMLIAVFILIGGTILAFNINTFYSGTLNVVELDKLKTLIILLTLNMAIFLPFNVLVSISIAHERYIFNKSISMLSTIVAPLLNFVMLFLGFKSIGLVISSMVINIVMYSIYVAYNARTLKIKPRFKDLPTDMLKEIFTFSFFVFLAEIVNILYWSTDKLLIGGLIGPIAVAVYNIGAVFNNYIMSISTAVSGVLSPKVTTMVTKNATKVELSELFIRVGRLQYIIISLFLSGFIVFGSQFIYLWAGKDYSQSYIIALLVMVPVAVPLIQNTGLSILIAQNKHRYRAIVFLIIAVVNVVSSYFLIQYYGIIGGAIATCIAYIIGPVIIMNRYYYKYIGIDIPLFWKNIIKMSPVMIILIIVGLILTNLCNIYNWLALMVGGLIFAVVFLVCSYIFIMNNYEKDIFRKPVLKIVSKIKR